MTDNTEPTIDSLYKKIDYILSTLIVVACDYEAGKDVDLDAQANLTNHVLQALISDQVSKARIDELIGVRGWTEYEPDPKYSPAERFHIVPYTYLTKRIEELKRSKE